MKPSDSIKKTLGAIQDWIQRPERERQEEALRAFSNEEVLLPTPQQINPRSMELDFTTEGVRTPMPEESPTGGSTISVAALLQSKQPRPDKPAAPRASGDAQPRKIAAGMLVREQGQRGATSGPIMQNKQNDTVYTERNARAVRIHNRYARFGEAVATAILAKTFQPGGMALLLEKLGLALTGSYKGDHDAITAFLEDNGAEEFCRRLGVRVTAAAPDKIPDNSPQTGRLVVKAFKGEPPAPARPASSEGVQRPVVARETGRSSSPAVPQQPARRSTDMRPTPVASPKAPMRESARTSSTDVPQQPQRRSSDERTTPTASFKPPVRETRRKSPSDLVPKLLRPTPPAEAPLPVPPAAAEPLVPQQPAPPQSPRTPSGIDTEPDTRLPRVTRQQGKSNANARQFLNLEFDTSFDG